MVIESPKIVVITMMEDMAAKGKAEKEAEVVVYQEYMKWCDKTTSADPFLPKPRMPTEMNVANGFSIGFQSCRSM